MWNGTIGFLIFVSGPVAVLMAIIGLSLLYLLLKRQRKQTVMIQAILDKENHA